MKPNQQISRQEAASIVARILSLQPVDTTATLQRFFGRQNHCQLEPGFNSSHDRKRLPEGLSR